MDAASSVDQVNVTEESDEVSATDSVAELFQSWLRSVVWKHFQRVKIEGIYKAQCKYCGRHYSGTTTARTSHLHAHLKTCAKKKAADTERESSSTFLFDHVIARRELANMIIMHEYPLSIVEHVGFRTFIISLQPEFKCPSRNTIKKDILNIFMEEKKRVMKFFDESVVRFAITTDMWTTDNQKKGYMGSKYKYMNRCEAELDEIVEQLDLGDIQLVEIVENVLLWQNFLIGIEG